MELAMNTWNMTEKRKVECLKMLGMQHTVNSVAQHFGVCRQTLAGELVKCGIDAVDVRNNGRLSMRAMLFNTVHAIRDDAKRVAAGLAYLDRYPPVDVDVDAGGDIVDVEIDISAQILAELDG